MKRLIKAKKKKQKSITELLDKYSLEPGHAATVSMLALKLFAETSKITNLKRDHVKILWAAAMLHDIGYYNGKKNHSKNGYDLIINSNLNGWNYNLLKLIAFVVKNHTQVRLDKKTKYTLTKSEKKLVKCIIALLRIADAMDDSHLSLINNFKWKKIRDKKNSWMMIIYTNNIIDGELKAIRKKIRLFKDTFGVKIRIKHKPIKYFMEEKQMKRVPVESSNIRSIGYDSTNSILEIQFNKGDNVYRYYNVPEEVYEKLMASESKGKFFYANISREYEYENMGIPTDDKQ